MAEKKEYGNPQPGTDDETDYAWSPVDKHLPGRNPYCDLETPQAVQVALMLSEASASWCKRCYHLTRTCLCRKVDLKADQTNVELERFFKGGMDKDLVKQKLDYCVLKFVVVQKSKDHFQLRCIDANGKHRKKNM